MAAIMGGGSVGLLGTYVVGFRMPFLGVAIAHAAMAGYVLALLMGWPGLPVALALAFLAAAGMAWLTSTCSRADLNTVTSILLSLTMGLVFLGMGLNKGDMSPLLGLMWGSILFVRPADVAMMSALAVLLILFVALFHRQLDALLFSRAVAQACGINERLVMTLFLALAAVLITINLQVVGGLMMYGLLTCPAATAYELAQGMRATRLLALGTGLASTLGGFWISYGLNLPTGACIVLVASLLYLAAVAIGRMQRYGNRQIH
jgi:manganese/iron transport system permease protein